MADVPLDGWADVELKVCSKNQGEFPIQGLLLVSRNCLGCPLSSSNVLEEIIETNQEQHVEIDISTLLKEALSISGSTVEDIVST